MSIRVDTSEVKQLARDLDKAADKKRGYRDALRDSSNRIRDHLRMDAHSSGRTRHFAGSITDDVFGSEMAEIGPDKGRKQGPLGNLLYFEPSRFHLPAIEEPLHRESDRFANKVADEAEDIL